MPQVRSVMTAAVSQPDSHVDKERHSTVVCRVMVLCSRYSVNSVKEKQDLWLPSWGENAVK